MQLITAKKAVHERHQNKELMIDVRKSSEHFASPVIGAHNITRSVLEIKTHEIKEDPKRSIYLHCVPLEKLNN